MNKFFHFRGLRSQGHTIPSVSPHVARLSAETRRTLRRAKRAAQWAEDRKNIAAFWATYSPTLCACLLAIIICFGTLQTHTESELNAERSAHQTTQAERDQWKALATKSATDQLTINFSGNAGTVREQLRALARVER
jgi:hypothetical protein